MFKLVVLAVVLAVASANPTAQVVYSSLGSPVLSSSSGLRTVPVTYTSGVHQVGSPLVYSSGVQQVGSPVVYSSGLSSPVVYSSGLSSPVVYQTVPKVQTVYKPVEQHGYQIAY